MLRTKYIHFTNGGAALFNEASGIEHWVMLRDHFPQVKLMDAGFAYHERGFKVYGQSTSLGVSSNPFAAVDLNTALRNGELRIREFPHDHYYAAIGGDGAVAHSIDDLYTARILIDSD